MNKILERLFGWRPKNNTLNISRTPAVWKSTIPGDMTMEEWQNGGFSRFNHPEYIKPKKNGQN